MAPAVFRIRILIGLLASGMLLSYEKESPHVWIPLGLMILWLYVGSGKGNPKPEASLPLALISVLLGALVLFLFHGHLETSLLFLAAALPFPWLRISRTANNHREALEKLGISNPSPGLFRSSRKPDWVIFSRAPLLSPRIDVLGIEIDADAGLSESEILKHLASLARESSHPLASAFSNLPEVRSLEPIPLQGFKTLKGWGLGAIVGKLPLLAGSTRFLIECGLELPGLLGRRAIEFLRFGQTLVWFGWEGRFRGFIRFRLNPARSLSDAFKTLKKNGLRIGVFSGEARSSLDALIREAPVDRMRSHTPEIETLNWIGRRRSESLDVFRWLAPLHRMDGFLKVRRWARGLSLFRALERLFHTMLWTAALFESLSPGLAAGAAFALAVLGECYHRWGLSLLD